MANMTYECPQCKTVLIKSETLSYYTTYPDERWVRLISRWHESDPFRSHMSEMDARMYYCPACGYVEPHISEDSLKLLQDIEAGKIRTDPHEYRRGRANFEHTAKLFADVASTRRLI